MTNSGPLGQSTVLGPAPALDDQIALEAPSLRALFDMHAVYVWNALRRLGVPPPDIADLTHDVFLQVHRHLADYDPGRPVRPWLFGFAYRVASQHRRSVRRRREAHFELDMLRDEGRDPEEQAAAEEDRRLVIAALQAVDFHRRAVFVLYELEDVPIGEIATSLGIPANTVYSRLRVARAEFAAAVKRLKARRGAP